MKTKVLALFFVALFSSSFAHEWYNGQKSLHEYESSLGGVRPNLLDAIKNFKGGDFERNEKTPELRALQSSTSICYYSPPSKPGVFVIVDVDALVCIIFDTVNNLVCCCDGTLGTAIIINLTNNKASYCLGVWRAAVVDIKVFVASVNLRTILNSITNVAINLISPTFLVLNLSAKILGILSATLNIQVSANLSGALNLLISTCTGIMVNIRVNLAGLLVLGTSDYVVIKGGLSAFIAILVGLVDLCTTANLNINTLILAGVLISLGQLIGCPDGIQAFVYVCLQIGAHYDLSILLVAILSNITVFLRICIELGGNIYIGVNGIIQVILAVYLYVNGTIQLDECLLVIINVCVTITSVINIQASLNNLQLLISTQTNLWNNYSGLSVLINFLTALLNGTLVLSAINISLIVTILSGGLVTTCLDLCIYVIQCLTVYVNATITVELYWITFLRVTLFLCKTVSGRYLINILLPGLSVSINLLGVCLNLLSGLSITISDVLNVLNTSGVIAACLYVPILNTIVSALQAAILAIANINIYVAINAASVVVEKNNIAVWLGLIANLGC